MTIMAVYRDPFRLAMPHTTWLPDGITLAGMVERMTDLPPDFRKNGVICINGRPVYRSAWCRITPKAEHNGVPVEVTFHAAMLGGENGGKQILALVASIALSFGASSIIAGKLATAGGLFAAKSLSAYALASGVSLAGALLLSALAAPPVKAAKDVKPIEGAASAQGNILAANAAIPRVIGERKIFPPLAAEPLTYFEGPDEVVEAVYALAGPHRLTDIKVGNAAIADASIEYETREGWPGDARLEIVGRQGRTELIQSELVGHTVTADDGRTLDTTSGDLTAALPQPYVTVTRDAPDEHWIHIAFAAGLHKNASETDLIRVPLRLRIRLAGDTVWINLPELHFQAANIRQIRATIALVWTSDLSAAPNAAAPEGFVEARHTSVGQTIAPVSADWIADSYFATVGDVWLSSLNLGTTGVQHVTMDRYTAQVLLDPAVFPRGRYEIEITRGAAVRNVNYSASAYTVSGVVWDLFGYQGEPKLITQSRNGVSDSLFLLRSVSVWNEHPVPSDEFALIAVRARNRAVDQVSVVAGGWVDDWDGIGWRVPAITDNPAPHLRAIFAGVMNTKPVPEDIIDDDDLVAWRSDCTARGLTCNHILEDQSVLEAANIVAACGYARPRMSDQWGVVRDHDRSADTPVQIFTPRNSSGFTWSRAFPDLPDGFRVSFADRDRDYDQHQITVARPGFIGAPRVLEQVAYEGLVTAADVTDRAIFDLRQPELRGTFYSLEAPAEALVCRRGSLVGVAHDMLTRWMGGGRVVDMTFNGTGLVTSLTLDSTVETVNEPDFMAITDFMAVADVLLIGQSSGVVIRGPSGPGAAVALNNATGVSDTLELVAPMAANAVELGSMVTVGLAGHEILRLLVFAIQPHENLTATLTLVDEAQELWAA